MDEVDENTESIGGIPLPEKFTDLVKSRKNFRFYQHRAFGEETLTHYDNRKLDLTNANNTITGLEVAVQAGAEVIEVDLMKTNDDEYVLNHPSSPIQTKIDLSLDEFLKKQPEALTFSELLDWLAHQDSELQIYLELKSGTDFKMITEEIKKADPDGKGQLNKKLMLYGSDTKQIAGYLDSKRDAGLRTDDLKLWWLTNGLVSQDLIDKVAALGEDGNRIYGIEQGMMPWGTSIMVDKLPTFMGGVGKDFADVVKHAHNKNLKLITGTVDKPKMIRWLAEQKVDGVVPNNVVDFEMAGIKRPVWEYPIKLANEQGSPSQRYLPESMKQRLRHTT